MKCPDCGKNMDLNSDKNSLYYLCSSCGKLIFVRKNKDPKKTITNRVLGVFYMLGGAFLASYCFTTYKNYIIGLLGIFSSLYGLLGLLGIANLTGTTIIKYHQKNRH